MEIRAMIAFIFLLLFGSLATYSVHRCDLLDVQTGRRDPGCLQDDYGSNIGFYWPWSPLYIGGLFGGFVSLCYLVPHVIG
jgi:hypothetical protein